LSCDKRTVMLRECEDRHRRREQKVLLLAKDKWSAAM
jgi:hypothetical protein